MRYDLKARNLVREFILWEAGRGRLESPEFHTNLVSFSMVRNSWTALVSTTLSDGKIYQVEYVDTRKESFVSVYQFQTRKRFSDAEFEVKYPKNKTS